MKVKNIDCLAITNVDIAKLKDLVDEIEVKNIKGMSTEIGNYCVIICKTKDVSKYEMLSRIHEAEAVEKILEKFQK